MLRVHCAVLKTREPLYPPIATGRIRTEHLHRVTAVTARGKRPVPFRTRKLSLSAPMVLHPPGCGRVGRRRNTIPNRGGHMRYQSYMASSIGILRPDPSGVD